MSGGRTSLVFRVEIGTAKVVCKIARRFASSPLFPIAPETEISLLARAAPHGIAPPPVAHLRDGLRQIVLHRHCEGAVCNHPPAELGACLARVHEIAPGSRWRLPLHPTFASGCVAAGLDEVAREWSPKAYRAVERVVVAAMRRPGAAPTLTHGDPVAANMVRSATGLTLIDWQCAGLADPVRDLAIALSPGMQRVYGRGDLQPGAAKAILESYGNPAMAARLTRLAPAFHAQMIGHCLRRVGQGDLAYSRAISAELTALATAIDVA